MRRAKLAATRAIQVRFSMPPVNYQIPNVRYPGEGIGENEDGIPFVEQGIAQQQQRSRKAQPPESGWYDDSFQLFRRIPLHEEAAEEYGVSHPTNHLPYAPLDAKKLPIVPNQIV